MSDAPNSGAAVRRPGRGRTWGPWIPLFVVVALVLVIGSLGDTGPATNEERVVAIAKTIKCPECDGESMADSNSALSRAARVEIAEQVQAGRSDEDIRAWVEENYEGLLLTPTSSGVQGLIWIIPVVVFVFSVAGLVVAFRRWNDERPVGSADDADRDLVRRALEDEHRRQAEGPPRSARR